MSQWEGKEYYLTNLWYRLFWKPNIETLYKNKSTTRYSHGGSGWYLGTVTSVIFIDDRKKRHVCSYRINDNNQVSIKIGKKIKYFNRNNFEFSKTVKESHYWGQGGGSIRAFTYTIKRKLK